MKKEYAAPEFEYINLTMPAIMDIDFSGIGSTKIEEDDLDD